MMPRSGTAVAGRRRPARCPAAALRKMAVRLLRIPVDAMRRAAPSSRPVVPAPGCTADCSSARPPPMTHGPASAPGYPCWREDPASIAAAPVIATGLRASPLLTPLRLASAAGVNAKAITTYMGHASIQTTYDLYGKLMPGSEAEAAALVDAYLARAGAPITHVV